MRDVLAPLPSVGGAVLTLAERRIDDADAVRAAFEQLRQLATFDFVPAGLGRTRAQHALLMEVAACDLSLARLVEGHTDACVIRRELDARPHAGGAKPTGDGESAPSYGVWAADDPRAPLRAERTARGYRLHGCKRYASGASILDRALVTATCGTEAMLFDADLSNAGVKPVDGTWLAVGMADTGSVDVVFEDVEVGEDARVGRAGAYVHRPGFEHGGVRVAACWAGGALGVVRAMFKRLRAKSAVDAHDAAAFGTVMSTLGAMIGALDHAADRIERDPHDEHGAAAEDTLHVRSVVERGVTTILHEAGRAMGSSAMVFDRAHARRVADLQVYVRQHHGERDLERLGRMLLAKAPSPC